LTALLLLAALDCAVCHRDIAAKFALTAHANASRLASEGSILGSFEPGANQLFTRNPGVYFKMERRAGGFYQTGVAGGRAQTERFDVVIGSGRRGQSYLYWRGGALYQLPVSYHQGTKRWINSPGYEDGKVHFDRLIPVQCLDCHTTRAAKGLALGIQCANCHGNGERHEQLKRPKGVDVCARCHGGLADAGHPPAPDVHGNQTGLLKASRCYQQSRTMTCATCHDVHTVQRDTAALSMRCAACHACKSDQATPARCVDCHMPLEQSKLIEVQSYRTHRIAVYKKK
jgi:hypothetical protein